MFEYCGGDKNEIHFYNSFFLKLVFLFFYFILENKLILCYPSSPRILIKYIETNNHYNIF